MKYNEAILIINEIVNSDICKENIESALKMSVDALKDKNELIKREAKVKFKSKIQKFVDDIYEEMMRKYQITMGEIFPEQGLKEDEYIDSLADILAEILVQNMD